MTAKTMATIIDGGIGVVLGLFATVALRRSHRRSGDLIDPGLTSGPLSWIKRQVWLGPCIIFGAVLVTIGNLTIMAPRASKHPVTVWAIHSTSDGFCRADFPGRPVEETSAIPGGDQVRVLSVLTANSSVGYYLSHWKMQTAPSALPPGRLAAICLDTWPSGFQPEVNFSEVSRKEISVAGASGMAAEFKSEKGIRMQAVIFLANGSVYVIYVLTSKNVVDPGDAVRFLGSIRFKHSPQ